MHPRKISLAITVALATLATASQASTISFQTRASSDQFLGSANAYRTTVEGLTASAATGGYCDASPTSWSGLSNQAVCGGVASDIAFDIRADFGVGSGLAGIWQFRVGPDFGRGGALFIDGAAIAFADDNLWWSGSFANTGEIFTASLSLSAGNHTIEVYGFEDCCDGVHQAEFMAPGATFWTIFSNNDGLDRQSGTVPEPAPLLLASLGLLGLGIARRRAR